MLPEGIRRRAAFLLLMASPKTLAEIDRLEALMRQLLSYDPQTGIFRWRVKRKRVFAGDVAGSVSPLGYRMIAVDKKDYAAQNLAWLWMTHQWPIAEVDHIDLNKDNNAWSNLPSGDALSELR